MQRLLQFTLDLFSSDPAPSPPAKKPRSRPRAKKPAPTAKPRLVQDTASQPAALSSGPSLPEQTLKEALAPATFRHPQASREAVLSGVLVGYAFKRGKRRTIGFSVGPEGLAVSAPKWVPLPEIDRSVQEKADWILKKLQETRERHQRLESARIVWENGAVIPFLGGSLRLVLDPRHSFSSHGAQHVPATSTTDDMSLGQDVLQLGLPLSASPEQVRDAAQAWLMRHASQLFKARLDHFAPQLGVQWRRLSLSSAGTRWGSASVDGSIRLNWRLIHFRLPVIDYVVVHELSHLRVMDHSPRFWDTVRAIVPDYAELRGQLKEEPIPKW